MRPNARSEGYRERVRSLQPEIQLTSNYAFQGIVRQVILSYGKLRLPEDRADTVSVLWAFIWHRGEKTEVDQKDILANLKDGFRAD